MKLIVLQDWQLCSNVQHKNTSWTKISKSMVRWATC